MLDGEVYQILDWQHRQAPKAPPTLTLRVKHLSTGNVLEKKTQGNQKITLAPTQDRNAQYLYKDDRFWYFMDNYTFDQFEVEKSLINDVIPYIVENDSITFKFYKDSPIMVELPPSVTLTIEQTEPGLRGDTQSGATKPAITNTGLTLQVPLFIKQGQRINVSTQTGEYLGRAE